MFSDTTVVEGTNASDHYPGDTAPDVARALSTFLADAQSGQVINGPDDPGAAIEPITADGTGTLAPRPDRARTARPDDDPTQPTDREQLRQVGGLALEHLVGVKAADGASADGPTPAEPIDGDREPAEAAVEENAESEPEPDSSGNGDDDGGSGHPVEGETDFMQHPDEGDDAGENVPDDGSRELSGAELRASLDRIREFATRKTVSREAFEDLLAALADAVGDQGAVIVGEAASREIERLAPLPKEALNPAVDTGPDPVSLLARYGSAEPDDRLSLHDAVLIERVLGALDSRDRNIHEFRTFSFVAGQPARAGWPA